MSKESELHVLLKTLCPDLFVVGKSKRIISNNLVRKPYFNIWARLLELSYTCLSDTRLRTLREEFRALDSLCLTLEERVEERSVYLYDEINPFARAGDIESKGRLENVTRIEKAVYLICKFALLNVISDSSEKEKEENITTMLGYAADKILDTAKRYGSGAPADSKEKLISSAKKDYLNSEEFIKCCDALAKNSEEYSMIKETDFLVFLTIKEKHPDLSINEIEELIYQKAIQTGIQQNKNSSIRDEYYEILKSGTIVPLLNGYRKILYTFIVSVCCCKISGSRLKSVLDEYFSQLNTVVFEDNKRSMINILSPVKASVYRDKIDEANLIGIIDPFVRPFISIELEAHESQSVNILFKGRTFTKTVNCGTGETCIDLDGLLTREEKQECFERRPVISLFDTNAKSTAYARMYGLKQLGAYGTEEDLGLLAEQASDNNCPDPLYVSTALKSLIYLSIRSDNASYSNLISSLYSNISKADASYSTLHKAYRQYLQFLHDNHKLVKCRLTVNSPVSVNVYLNGMENRILSIDKNEEKIHNSCEIEISKESRDDRIIFVTRGFKKRYYIWGVEGEEIQLDINDIASRKEIINSYSLEDVYAHKDKLTFYSLQQLSQIGRKEDIAMLLEAMNKLPSKRTNIRYPKMVECLCTLISKYKAAEYIDQMRQISKDCADFRSSVINDALESLSKEMKIAL